jgi:hypothetical protein
MRVLFERSDVPVGRRRVVIGHVVRDGGPASFRPAVIVYDRPPESENRGASTVEIWGDLFVRGTAYLTGAQRVEPGGTPETGIKDSLDLLLRQLAGPMADALRAFLLGDPDWLDDLAGVVAKRAKFLQEIVDKVTAELTTGAALDTFAAAVVDRITADPVLAQRVADATAGRVQASAATAQTFADAIAARVQVTSATAQVLADAVAGQVTANAATAQTVATAVAGRVAANTATAQTIADAVAARAQVTSGTAQVLADAIAARVTANTATAQTIADAVAGRVQVTDATADTFAARVVTRVDATATLSTTVAEIVVDEVEPGTGNFRAGSRRR